MKVKKVRRWLAGVLLLFVLLSVCGCRTLSYYAQAAKGQYQILAREEPISELLRKPDIPPELKSRLQLVLNLRDFASRELKLPVDGHYRKYADLKRPYVVWNVEAAPVFSMEPKSWWYPFVGSLEYRGFFSERAARDYGQFLERKGYDVYVGGVTAYSTLGWFKDPVLNTFLFDPELDLAETIFHELGHQQVFASGDKDFNEAFAMLVGREGVRRWLRSTHQQDKLAQYATQTEREDEFADLVLKTRLSLESLYGDVRDEEGKVRASRNRSRRSAEELFREKEHIMSQMRDEYRTARQRWGADAGYDGWFTRPINNAKLNSLAAYHEFIPGFQRLLELNAQDLPRFYDAAEKLSKMKKDARHRWLHALASKDEK